MSSRQLAGAPGWLVIYAAVITGVAVVLLAVGWYLLLARHAGPVTVQPPCYVNVPGFHLPPGGKWC